MNIIHATLALNNPSCQGFPGLKGDGALPHNLDAGSQLPVNLIKLGIILAEPFVALLKNIIDAGQLVAFLQKLMVVVRQQLIGIFQPAIDSLQFLCLRFQAILLLLQPGQLLFGIIQLGLDFILLGLCHGKLCRSLCQLALCLLHAAVQLFHAEKRHPHILRHDAHYPQCGGGNHHACHNRYQNRCMPRTQAEDAHLLLAYFSAKPVANKSNGSARDYQNKNQHNTIHVRATPFFLPC